MITRFHVENFKSLAKFDLTPPGQDLAKFTCLIGLNGSGKSTLLQALDFVGHLAADNQTGADNVGTWLAQRNWKPADALTRPGKSSSAVTFEIGFRFDDGEEAAWCARYNVKQLCCSSETVRSGQKTLLNMEAGRLLLAGPDGAETNATLPLIQMPSFDRFRTRLEEVALQMARNPGAR